MSCFSSFWAFYAGAAVLLLACSDHLGKVAPDSDSQSTGLEPAVPGAASPSLFTETDGAATTRGTGALPERPPAADEGGVPKTQPDASGAVEEEAGTYDAGSVHSCDGPAGTLSGALATGVVLMDTDGQRVNAHGGGIIRVGDTFYLHGEYFLATSTDNNFNGFSMYSSRDFATWKNEGIILPQQPSGELGPNRKGERPHIIRCPATGEFVLYAHAASADYKTDREVVYATSKNVVGPYAYQGPLKNARGQIAAHSDMSALADATSAYVVTEGGHVYTLASDCHSWVSDQVFPAVNGNSGGAESPVVFRARETFYWIGSYKTGWRANNNFYATAPSILGPWTYQGYVAPVSEPANNLSDERTWLSQSTWVQAVEGCAGTTFVYWGDHWDGNLDTKAPGKHNYLASYVLQPLVFDGLKISMPRYLAEWTLDVGAGTWSTSAVTH
jgi:hypothetical protein